MVNAVVGQVSALVLRDTSTQKSSYKKMAGAGIQLRPLLIDGVCYLLFGKSNIPKRSSMAGLLTGTYGLPGAVIGLGKLSRLRDRDSLQSPVPLDELQDRNVIGVIVRDVAGLGVGRNHDQRNARAVAEEVERLHVTGVVVAAAFVEGDEDGGVLPERRIRLDRIDDLLGEAFEQIQLGRCRVAIDQSAGLDEGDGGQRSVLDVRRTDWPCPGCGPCEPPRWP